MTLLKNDFDYRYDNIWFNGGEEEVGNSFVAALVELLRLLRNRAVTLQRDFGSIVEELHISDIIRERTRETDAGIV